MTDQSSLLQQKFVQRDPATLDPEYVRLMAAYADNPFYDMTQVSVDEYLKKKVPPAEPIQPAV